MPLPRASLIAALPVSDANEPRAPKRCGRGHALARARSSVARVQLGFDFVAQVGDAAQAVFGDVARERALDPPLEPQGLRLAHVRGVAPPAGSYLRARPLSSLANCSRPLAAESVLPALFIVCLAASETTATFSETRPLLCEASLALSTIDSVVVS